MPETPTPETAGQISRRRSATTHITLGGYVGTLVVTDGLAPRVGVGPHASGKGGTPMVLQSMDVGQLDSLITILCELRDELLRPGGKPEDDGLPTVRELADRYLPPNCPPYCTKHNHEEMGG